MCQAPVLGPGDSAVSKIDKTPALDTPVINEQNEELKGKERNRKEDCESGGERKKVTHSKEKE